MNEIRNPKEARNPRNKTRRSRGTSERISRISAFGFRISLIFLSISVFAQTPLSNLVYTVGTTIRDSSNRDWSYVLLNSDDPQLLAGKKFAVYGKPGRPADPGTFTLRGNIARQTDAATINIILNQSVSLGEDLTSLSSAMNVVLHNVPGSTNLAPAQKILTAFRLEKTDPTISQKLLLLQQGNPGLNLCAGTAFSEIITGVTTYEIREIDPASGAAGQVIGRVTIVPNAPVILPAPGRPFQVVSNQPSDHLKIRLRWGTPPELRRLSLLNIGFNVWRIARATAEAGNFQNVSPTVSQLYSNPDFIRANRGAVFATMNYNIGSGAGAADDPSDRITDFFSDTGRASASPPFTDGEEFYYFITARDLLSRDGLVSPGGLARACRRLPPKAPTDLTVANAVIPGSTNLSRLKLTWTQNPNAEIITLFTNKSGTVFPMTNVSDQVSEYWIYRWQNPKMALTAPPLTNLISVVAHVPGANQNSFIDDTPGALKTPGLSNIWYTVRAVSQAACDPLLSPHSAPASGVLRQRDAPAITTGSVVGSCGIPSVMFQGLVTNTIPEDTQNRNFRFTCVRRDPGIAWVQFTITNIDNTVETIGPVYFPPDSDTARIDYQFPGYSISSSALGVSCIAGTFYDEVSQPATCAIEMPFAYTEQHEAIFFAGQLLTTALNFEDPLLQAINGASFCMQPYSVVADSSGMVALKFDSSMTTAMIRALTNNTWRDIGVVTADTNHVFWVSYPACLVGPLPEFRGCEIVLPDGADCDQHVARAAVGGAIAPLRIRFRLTPRTREYRLYRRADNGPLTLVAQGAANYDPAQPGKIIERRDEAMPPSLTRLCYYVQLLDGNGNGSPLSFLGCKEVKPATLPRPVLSEPQSLGNISQPQVALNWFCPTAGAARFQLKIKAVDAPEPSAPSGLVSAKLKIFPLYNKSASYLGLLKSKFFSTSFSEAQLTSPIGPDFGPGPQFTLNADVRANVTYHISVAAVDEQGHVGNASQVQEFKWKPPVVLQSVPWPARPLPAVRDFDEFSPGDVVPQFSPRVSAVLFKDANMALVRRYPVGVRIGELPEATDPVSNVNANYLDDYVLYYPTRTALDPNTGIFRSISHDASHSGQLLLPIVLYRQQVTNAVFPKVSGDVVQASPLIERIPWRVFQGVITIPDRLFAGNYEYGINQSSKFFLYLRDQQPVIAGAKYRYFVMRFNEKREPEEIIPAGEVEIPQMP